MPKIGIENAGPSQINFCRFHSTSTILLCNKVKIFQSPRYFIPYLYNIPNALIVQNSICVIALKKLKDISKEISSELKSEHFNIPVWGLDRNQWQLNCDHHPCHNRTGFKFKKQCLLSKEIKNMALKLPRLHILDSMYNRIQCIYLLQRFCLNTPWPGR